MSQCEQLAKSQRQGRRSIASAKKSQENTYVEFFEGNLFDNEQAKIYTPPPPH